MAVTNNGAASPGAGWTCTLVLVWYASSSVAVLLLKALFTASLGASPFKFPLTITATSNIVSSFLAALVRPSISSNVADAPAQRRYAILIGTATAGEIGLSNWALNVLTVTLATMLKGTAPLLVLLWGVALGIYAPDVRRLGVALAVCIGLGLAVYGQRTTQESSLALRIGLIAQILSGALSGFRWVITQLFVKGSSGTHHRRSALLEAILRCDPDPPRHAIDVIRSTAPWTAAAIAPFAIVLEGYKLVRWFVRSNWLECGTVVASVVSIGVCVFVLLWSEYALVKCTSSLTVSIGFVAKEVIMIGLGFCLFRDVLNATSIAGFFIAQAGLVWYAFQKDTATVNELPQYADN